MARVNCKILDNGDAFPKMKFNVVNNDVIVLPDNFGNKWNVLIFYRGHW